MGERHNPNQLVGAASDVAPLACKKGESISLQRLGELVTDLYLAEGKSRATKWKQIATALERSGVPKTEIDHLLKKDDVSLLAKKMTELSGK